MRRLILQILIGSVCVRIGLAEVQTHPSPLQRELAEMAEQSIGNNWPPPRLRELPRETVIDALINALETGLYQDAKTQHFAYQALAELKAADTENGYRQLLSCLDDSTNYLALCELALLENAPSEKMPEVVDTVVAIFSSGKHSTTNKEIALQFLPKAGVYAKPHLGTVERIFLDVQATNRMRQFAAHGILQIGSIEHALTVFNDVEDLLGRKIALTALTLFGGETKGTFGSDDSELRRKVRDFIRLRLNHPDKEVRELAFQAFLQAYGDEAVLGDKERGYVANPEFIAALESVAQNDPDGQMRFSTRELLERHEKFVAKKNRERDNY